MSFDQAAKLATSPVMVGWMHLYDPVAASAIESWNDDGHRANVVRVSVVLPPNGGFERAATEIVAPTPAASTAATPRPPEAALREALLTLAVHDLPLVRRLLPAYPTPIEVTHASWRAPWGYLVLMRIGDVRVELHASMGQPWKPTWTLEAISRAREPADRLPSVVRARRVGDLTHRHEPADASMSEPPWPRTATTANGAASPRRPATVQLAPSTTRSSMRSSRSPSPMPSVGGPRKP